MKSEVCSAKINLNYTQFNLLTLKLISKSTGSPDAHVNHFEVSNYFSETPDLLFLFQLLTHSHERQLPEKLLVMASFFAPYDYR